jgi:hypothetical protein
MEDKQYGYQFRHNNFCFEMRKLDTRGYASIFFYVGRMAVAPYTRIAILVPTNDRYLNENKFFKDVDGYGNARHKTARYLYALDRDDDSLDYVQELAKTFDGDNLVYLSSLSDVLLTQIVALTFNPRRESFPLVKVKYKDENYDYLENCTSYKRKEAFVNTLLTSSCELVGDDVFSGLKERNDFIFVVKKLSILHENNEHELLIRVGRSKNKVNEKFAVIALDENVFYIKLDDENGALDYNSHVMCRDIVLNDNIRAEIMALSEVVTIEQASREKMYVLTKHTSAGHYESGSSDHSTMMAMSKDRDMLVKRYNDSVKDEDDKRVLIEQGKYSTRFSGNTGGGCSHVSHQVSISEFRDFDMPELER